ncbi:hypothetical protein HanXRQr2_Chr03g0102851 [Helianthus annuus]|uniref:Uncharacterized protein n=1 Tax=Helianthus annuus TaxID=4232 RepID=A0A251V7P5_HELAN|nr:hypothetical protein HanXRQr2_Chr03g0102851 [Helianthus annuus]
MRSIGTFQRQPNLPRSRALHMLKRAFRDCGQQEHANMGIIRDPDCMLRIRFRLLWETIFLFFTRRR